MDWNLSLTKPTLIVSCDPGYGKIWSFALRLACRAISASAELLVFTRTTLLFKPHYLIRFGSEFVMSCATCYGGSPKKNCRQYEGIR